MAGAHLRGRTRGVRIIVTVALAALAVGLLVGGAVTLALMGDGEASVGTDDSGGGVAVDGLGLAAADPGVTPVDTGNGPITIAFAGDINVERSLATRLEDDPEGFVGPFAELLRGADLAIGNLEAALTSGGSPIDKEFVFRAPPSVLDALAAGGFDVISAANNHGMDYGAGGLAESLEIKRARADGMVIGIGGDEDEAFAPHISEVGGHTVAVIAATQVIDANLISAWTATEEQGGLASAKRVDRLVEEVEAARAVADTVVVYLHWGIETETCPSESQQELAQTLSDAGADLIIGTHAHRVQSGGRLGSSMVGYGLGNFLFGAVSDESAKTGVLLVEVDGRDVLGYEWRPGRVSDRVPIPLDGDDAEAAVDEWDDLRDCTNLSA
ncbi:CapA family protein [Actinospongicola halichondriae]|uniref:CapA family protein n=1 Tax=Actinospongicola halichondriae TaxID=3236844 RepID=UPI003D42F885